MPAPHHIENPFEFFLEKLSWAASDVDRALSAPRPHTAQTPIVVRRIEARDLWDALRKGLADLGAIRDDVLLIAVIYPVAGLVLARAALNNDLLPLVFPLASGFALIGPLAAVGLYEMSRRREQGLPVAWRDGFDVLRSPAIGSIIGLGAVLLGLFSLWLAAAYEIYILTLGPEPPVSAAAFVQDVVSTGAGWTMISVGMVVGFLFAVVALTISVVSFPLMLDRSVGLVTAITTSVRAVAANPGPMSLWGLIVAGSLVLGSAPALIGLIIVMPVLGHASWHLYRKLIGEAEA